MICVVGNCHGYLERYYFSGRSKRCLPFLYSGCNGNGNNFASKAECMDVCGRNSSQTPGINDRKEGVVEEVTIIPRVRSDCNKPISRGICSGSLKMYGYDMKSGECHNFTYSGCAGNSNRFFTLSSCKSVCEGGARSPHLPNLKRPRLRYIFFIVQPYTTKNIISDLQLNIKGLFS